MAKLLADAPLGRLVDIGTGTGRIATLFAPRAQQVLGVDRSAEMLRLARGKLGEEINGKVRFVAGDFYDLRLPAARRTPPFSIRCCIMPRRRKR